MSKQMAGKPATTVLSLWDGAAGETAAQPGYSQTHPYLCHPLQE